jgi:hypothetical protein
MPLLTVTTDAERDQVRGLDRRTTASKRDDVVNLELRVATAALRTGSTVAPHDQGTHLLPVPAAAQHPVRLMVPYPLTLPATVSAGTLLPLFPAAAWAEPKHRYILPGRLIIRTGCALGTILIGLVGLGGGFLIAITNHLPTRCRLLV